MPVPGLATLPGNDSVVRFRTSTNDVDLHTYLRSPSGAVRVTVIVEDSVVIGASLVTTAALDLSGFAAGSAIKIYNLGRIQGAGGVGGQGRWATGSDESAGGGGGGAGTVVGEGGEGYTGQPATMGDDGTATAGGQGGSSGGAGTGIPNRGRTNGGDGGDAIEAGDCDVTIVNASGEVWGGGGGGSGGDGVGASSPDAGDGGDPGEDGDDEASGLFPGSGGTAGYAVRVSGSGSATFASGGSAPNVKGLVS